MASSLGFTYADYIHRPNELEGLSSYEFVQDYDVVNVKYPTDSDFECYEFLPLVVTRSKTRSMFGHAKNVLFPL